MWPPFLVLFLISILHPNSADGARNDFENIAEISHQYNIPQLLNNIKNNIHQSSLLEEYSNELRSLNSLNDKEYDEKDNIILDMIVANNAFGKCLSDISYTEQSFRDLANASWALKLIDSYGKPGSGITLGNTKWYGNYLQCLDVYAPPDTNGTAGDFSGKYCLSTWDVKLQPNQTSPLSFTVGVCIPDTCSELFQELIKLLRLAKSIPFVNSNITSYANITSFVCKKDSKTLSAAAIGVIFLVSFFVFLVMLGSSVTVYEYFFVREKEDCTSVIIEEETKSTEISNGGNISNNQFHVDLLFRQHSNDGSFSVFETCKPFLKCFCIFSNGSRLLDTQSTEGQLLCIHGIRFLSMSWVILGHTYSFCFQEINNLLQSVQLTDNLAFQVIFQGFYSVDSFFVLSGFLLTYLFMKEYSKNDGKISWTYFYLHRFLRLTPVYMVALGIFATIYLYMGSGPHWPDYSTDPICKDWWWTNLLYINNFFSIRQICMGWSWYLANDMQFFVISPLFLITLWRWPKIGFSLLGLGLLGTAFANFYITYRYDVFAGIMNLRDTDLQSFMEKYTEFFEKLYIKPYTRIGPYLIGMITGYLLAKFTQRPKKMNAVALAFGWFVASSVTLTCVYGLYHKRPSKLGNSFYNAVNRSLFGAGLSWVIYVCLTGQAGLVNKILSYKLFIPLSRLTYTAYLIHPIILTGYFGSLKRTISFSHPTLVSLFLGCLLATYGCSILMSLIFESPIIGLEKLIRKKFSSRKRV